MGICDELVKEAGITSVLGRMIYNNKYCTSIALDMYMFNEYIWTIFGTITPNR